MTTPAILPSRNPDHGFFGTLTTCPERDRRSVEVWVLAATLIAKAIRATTEEDMIGIRDFLDSRSGQHGGLQDRQRDRDQVCHPHMAGLAHFAPA